ncbi:hypothetical protein niasHT_018069 [Heterodera trifolii]|uniref:Uncharacterized protein n=1 Tax=Heterodera trifolii TaxID=157864 RepID=A0ABD2LKL5_9BILA
MCPQCPLNICRLKCRWTSKFDAYRAISSFQLPGSAPSGIPSDIAILSDVMLSISCRCFFFADFSLFAGTLVMPLPDTLQARLFHMPKFRGFLKSALPERTNEIMWLQHMKFFVFDEHCRHHKCQFV